MEILAIIPIVIYIGLIVWFISVLNTIARNTARANETLERVLQALEGKPPQESAGRTEREDLGPGLPIFQAPDEHSTVLFRAPDSWALSFGDEQEGWFPVEIVGDAPMPVLHRRGWVREADLDRER